MNQMRISELHHPKTAVSTDHRGPGEQVRRSPPPILMRLVLRSRVGIRLTLPDSRTFLSGFT